METEKQGFSSVYGHYNKSYQESNLNQEIAKLESQIAELEAKRQALSFITSSDYSTQTMNPIQTIHSITLLNDWDDSRHIADGYGTDEEIYHFELTTNEGTFPVLLEFLGEENKLERNVYHLHTPNMDETSLLKVKAVVLSQFDTERRERILITHAHATLESEIDKLLQWVLCEKDYTNHLFSDDETPLFKQGNRYRAEKIEHGLNVEHEDKTFVYIPGGDAKKYFPTLY